MTSFHPSNAPAGRYRDSLEYSAVKITKTNVNNYNNYNNDNEDDEKIQETATKKMILISNYIHGTR